MKKLVALGLFIATVAVAGTAFADGGTGHDRQVQELMQWSNQVADAAKAAAQQKAQTAGPGAQLTSPVPPYQEYPGYPDSEQAAQPAGLGAEATKPVPPYQQYPGYYPVFEIN